MTDKHKNSELKKKPQKMTRSQKQKIKRAQAEGAFSSVAISHTSKNTIMKAFQDSDQDDKSIT